MHYDLHSHSTVSDGHLTPTELLARAAEQGVDVLALTDHDTCAGIEEARLAAQKASIQLIAGIEFSAQWGGRGIHILGLNVDVRSSVLQRAVAEQQEVRVVRGARIDERLARLGIEGALVGAQALAGASVLGRPHFAQFLIDKGRVKTVKEAFKKYLGAGKPGDVKNLWPELETVVAWIVAAGGVAVIAHPHKYKMTRTKLCALVDDFVAVGGQAIEVTSGMMPPGTVDMLARIARERGLYASCGSDFHFPQARWQELGKFTRMPDDCQPVWHLF